MIKRLLKLGYFPFLLMGVSLVIGGLTGFFLAQSFQGQNSGNFILNKTTYQNPEGNNSQNDQSDSQDSNFGNSGNSSENPSGNQDNSQSDNSSQNQDQSDANDGKSNGNTVDNSDAAVTTV